jgi:hypothetical protein
MKKYFLLFFVVLFLLVIINYDYISEPFISDERMLRGINSQIDYINYLCNSNSLKGRVSSIRD